MKNYKIIRIAGLHYQSIMESFYDDHPDMATRCYDDQKKQLFKHAYNYSNSFSKAMSRLGHDADEIVYDLEIMQKMWATENHISITDHDWQTKILLAQIDRMRPDILYFQDIHSLSYEIRKNLKSRFPFIKLMIIFRGYPGLTPSLLQDLSHADLLVVGSPILMEKCQASGLKPHLIHHYFDADLLNQVPQSKEKHDFTFIGSSGYNYGLGHAERYHMLRDLLRQSPITLWTDEHYTPLTVKKRIRHQLVYFLKYLHPSLLNKLRTFPLPNDIQNVLFEVIEHQRVQSKHASNIWKIPTKPISFLFPIRCHPALFGLEMYQKLAESKVTFNIHSTPAKGTADNIRLFQATGMGTCLLTDTGTNLPELFEKDHEVVTYSSLEECIEKVKYLLSHEVVRRQIAINGQKRTLRHHTADQRIQEMDEVIQAKI